MNFRQISRILTVLVVLGLLTFPTQGATAQNDGPVQVGVFEPFETSPGAVIEVPVSIENAQEVYALDIELQFDPSLLAAEDADPNLPGIQTGFGQFLDPGLVLFNQVDNAAGVIRFAMSQVNPSEPKSGSGIIFVLYFKGLAEGISPLTVNALQVASREGLEIPSSPLDSSVKISAGAPTPAATSIPVQNPTAMIVLPTPAPTPIPTLSPTALPTTMAVVEPTAELAQAQPTSADNQFIEKVEKMPEPAETPFLVRNWWIVAVVLGIVIVMGIYLLNSRKPSK